MGLFNTPENRRRQHIQINATGNIKDIDRIEQRERRRRIFIFFDVLAVFLIIIGILSIYYKAYFFGIVLTVIGIGIIIYFIFRKTNKKNDVHKKQHKHHHKHRH